MQLVPEEFSTELQQQLAQLAGAANPPSSSSAGAALQGGPASAGSSAGAAASSSSSAPPPPALGADGQPTGSAPLNVPARQAQMVRPVRMPPLRPPSAAELTRQIHSAAAAAQGGGEGADEGSVRLPRGSEPFHNCSSTLEIDMMVRAACRTAA